MLILAGVLLAIFFRAIAHFIHNKLKINFNLSLFISVILVLGLITLAGFYMAPKLSDQYQKMKEQVPQGYEKLKSNLKNSEAGRFVLDQIQQPLKGSGANIRQTAMTFFSTTFGVIGDIYVILLLALFFLANPAPYKKGIVTLVPPNKRERASEIVHATGTKLGSWLLGKLLSMLVVAVMTYIGLLLLGVPLAFTLAIIAGLLSFIPNFGPLIALIPPVLVALLKNPQLALYVVILYVSVQAIESNLILPYIQKHMVKVPMAFILISQVALGMLAGGLALILAVPFVLIVMVLVNMIYVQDILEKRKDTAEIT